MDRQRAVLELLAELTGRGVESLAPELELVADLGVDSVKALELLVELEDRLGIEIGDEQATGIDTVGDVLALVSRAGGGPPP